MVWLQCLEFSPRGWQVVVKVIATFFALVREEVYEAVKVGLKEKEKVSGCWVVGLQTQLISRLYSL